MKRLNILFVLVLLADCMPIGTPSIEIITPTETPLLSPTNTPIPTPLPTATSLAANWESAKNCVTEYPQQPEGNQLEGVAALRSLSSTVLSLNLSLLDLKDGISKVIDTANQSVWDVEVSPDGHTLAYSWFNSATSKWELVLLDSVGSLQEVAWSSAEWFAFRGWLNDHQLVILQGSKYFVVDPYQDSQLSFSPLDFPEFNSDHPDFFVSFDPSLSKVVYRDGQIDVLDLSSNTFIARIKDGYDRAPIISWRPSGDIAAVVASLFPEQNLHGLPDEIFIVEKDGQVRQLTHLFDTFGLPFPINTLSWSPDGDKIAFWYPDKEVNLNLMVTDYATGNTVNYCILNVPNASFPVSVSAPIWSPDGKYLMVENRYAPDKNKVLVVDLSNNSAFPIAKNASPIGWMVSP